MLEKVVRTTKTVDEVVVQHGLEVGIIMRRFGKDSTRGSVDRTVSLTVFVA